MSSSKRKLSSFVLANNDDLLIEIIVRLPTKSLLRFKCVSKHWLSLISSPRFSRRLFPDSHLVSGLILHRSSCLINPEDDFVPLTNKPITAPFKCLNFLKHPSRLRIQNSCHGLPCCSSFHDRHFKHDYYTYNPTTKQFVTLPPPGGRIIHGATLAYDPVKSPHYKVVCVRSPDSFVSVEEGPSFSYQIEIYSSETRSWRLSSDPFMAPVNMQFNGVSWNGNTHWIDCYNASLHFKVDKEQLREMPMPPSLIYPEDWEDGRRFMHFGESREPLHLVEIYGPCTTKFDVFEMERDYSCWFVKYRVDLNAITMAFPEMIKGYLDVLDLNYYAVSILGVIQEANDEESYMLLQIPGKVIHYNLNDKTFDKICKIDPGRADIEGSHFKGSLKFWWFHPFQYIGTLACV